MSRSDYQDDIDQWDLIRWRGAVSSAIRGKRGQRLLTELAAALDAMPVKALIAHELQTRTGEHCALGVLGCAKGIPLDSLDPEDSGAVAAAFDIADALAREVVYINDEAGWHDETPEKRWNRVRAWVTAELSRATSAKS